MIGVGDRVRTPEGMEGPVTRLRRQAEPHGGWRALAGLGPKRARPGEAEQLAEQAKTYAVVEVRRDVFVTYDVTVLERIG